MEETEIQEKVEVPAELKFDVTYVANLSKWKLTCGTTALWYDAFHFEAQLCRFTKFVRDFEGEPDGFTGTFIFLDGTHALEIKFLDRTSTTNLFNYLAKQWFSVSRNS